MSVNVILTLGYVLKLVSILYLKEFHMEFNIVIFACEIINQSIDNIFSDFWIEMTFP